MKTRLLPDEIHHTSVIHNPEDMANVFLTPTTMLPLQLDAEANLVKGDCIVAYCVGDAVANVFKEYQHELARGPFDAYLDVPSKNIDRYLGAIWNTSIIHFPALNEFAVCAVVFQKREGRYFPIYQCGKDFSPKSVNS